MAIEWHAMTEAEEDNRPYDIVLDVFPDNVPNRAAEVQGALVRTMKPGWVWRLNCPRDLKRLHEIGSAETFAEALDAGMLALTRFREREG